ncbi:ZPR1 zinc finger domain-containing protein [Stetteria hydrogenophila]
MDITDEIKASGRELKLLAREVAICPVCGRRTLDLSVYLYEVPYFDQILVSVGTCKSCGFKYRDVGLAKATKPKEIVVKVQGEEELRYLLVKPAGTGIIIPEQGYEIRPGPADTGFISTVEGILHRIMEALEVACKGVEDGSGECERHRRWLQEAIDGKRSFTLILCDYTGMAKVLGKKVEEREMGEECKRLLGE